MSAPGTFGAPDAARTLVFYSEFDDFDTWKRALQARLPSLRVVRADEINDHEQIDFALVWKPPAGFFARMTRLKLIVILGAGADSLAARDDLPTHVPITRISDPDMSRMMASYVLFAVLRHARDIPFFEAAQRRGEWAYKHPRNPEDVRVAVLGLGELGALAASELQRQGLTVLGWSRTPKQIDGVTCHAGLDALGSVLAQADIVVVMLPLTSATRGLLDRERLLGLRPGAALINVSRGAVVDQRALTELLQTGHIESATLDVFEREPLPPHDPLWAMPNVLITPHLASVAIPASAAKQIAENLLNITRGESLTSRVNMDREY